MNNTEQQKIESFISDIRTVNPEHAAIIEQVRDRFMAEDSSLTQGIKYGGLVFFQDGVLIGGVFPYKKHLSIEFSDGADFSDPSSQLEGKGKKRRHLKIHTTTDINAKHTANFVKQAVTHSHP